VAWGSSIAPATRSSVRDVARKVIHEQDRLAELGVVSRRLVPARRARLAWRGGRIRGTPTVIRDRRRRGCLYIAMELVPGRTLPAG
jgi:hypothetical protein